jgi:hypothetical protein
MVIWPQKVIWPKAVEIITDHFKYLEIDFGFKIISQVPPFVKYESNIITIYIYYDINGRNELDLGIKPLKKLDTFKTFNRGYDLEDLMRVNRDKGKEKYTDSFCFTEEEVETRVKELAFLLLKYGENLLKGDISDLIRVEAIRVKIEHMDFGEIRKMRDQNEML